MVGKNLWFTSATPSRTLVFSSTNSPTHPNNSPASLEKYKHVYSPCKPKEVEQSNIIVYFNSPKQPNNSPASLEKLNKVI